jgi:hypothetical protein
MSSPLRSLLLIALLGSLPLALHAWEPDARTVETAIQSGDFAGYLADASIWLDRKLPTKLDEAALTALLKDSVFRNVLDRRQLIAKAGADKLAAFVKASPDHPDFLRQLLTDTPAMDLLLEAAVPIGLKARAENSYTLDTASLGIWARILKADLEAKDGIYQKMAIATALAPPGSINIGAGGAEKPAAPVTRYRYFKTAHRNKELLPSFDHLSVWEYSRILSSGATDTDLTWARKMINTFRPDLLVDEMVVSSTSLVWRRGAPAQFYPKGYVHFKNVLAGGGKCGPRSSWSQMVSHAFGIPAIGVRQPGHVCVAYKAANPMTQPQPGSTWKVGYGRGWNASKLLGITGAEFLDGIAKRSDPKKFSAVEHLRWIASALAAPGRAAAVMEVAHRINDSITMTKTDLSGSLKPEEADADLGAKAGAQANATVTPAPITDAATTAVSGLIHVEAASFSKTGGKISWGGQFPHVLVHDSVTGGKQVYFQQQMREQWTDYSIEVAAAGTYAFTMKAACINVDQTLQVLSGTEVLATVNIPLSHGLWVMTEPLELSLEAGAQTIRVQTPTTEHKRGIALRWFRLKKK